MSEDLAMLIEAVANRDTDPLTRFIRSLPNEPPIRLRSHAEDTVRLRTELLSNTQRALSCTDPREAATYAEWISKNIHEVAYRWTGLMRSVQKWSLYDFESVVYMASPSRREEP